MLRSPWRSVRSVGRRYVTVVSKIEISGVFLRSAQAQLKKAGMRLVVLKLLSNHFLPSKRQ